MSSAFLALAKNVVHYRSMIRTLEQAIIENNSYLKASSKNHQRVLLEWLQNVEKHVENQSEISAIYYDKKTKIVVPPSSWMTGKRPYVETIRLAIQEMSGDLHEDQYVETAKMLENIKSRLVAYGVTVGI